MEYIFKITNVALVVGKKKLYFYKNILVEQSRYFKSYFYKNNDNDIKILFDEDVQPIVEKEKDDKIMEIILDDKYEDMLQLLKLIHPNTKKLYN